MFPEKVAIIGCGGFIGVHLTARLLHLGIHVEGWDLASHRLQKYLGHPLFTFHNEDYAQLDVVEQIARSHTVVFHLAALCNPSLYNTEDERVMISNGFHPALLADACARHGSHLIYVSTSEVYGMTLRGQVLEQGISVAESELSDVLTEDSSPLLLGPIQARRWSYACAKQFTERYLVALGVSRNLPWTMIRPFNFLGPHMDFIPGVDGDGIPRVMASFMDALMHQRPMQLVDGGLRKRAFTWIGDAIEAMVRILERREACQGLCFNLGNPQNECTIQELAARMSKQFEALGGKLCSAEPWEFVSALEFYGAGYQDSDRRLPDIRNAREILQWEPQMGLEDTLRSTMIWYMEYYQGKL